MSTITRRAYILTVIGMPLFFALMMAIPVLSGRSAAASNAGAPVAIVDGAGLIDLDFANQQAVQREEQRSGRSILLGPRLVKYDTLDGAIADLAARRVGAVYAIDADYLETGIVKAYGPTGGLLAQAFAGQRQTQVADAIRANLLRAAMTDGALARAYAPTARLERFQVGPSGAVEASSDTRGIGSFAGSFAVLILFSVSIFFSAGFLQQATIEDRQNRVMEILLSSVTAEELLIGKIVGLGAAGLLQVLFYVLLIIVPGTTMLGVFDVPMQTLALSLMYFVIGYLLFACLMAGTGMIGRTPQESAQLSAVWTLTAISPLWFMPAIGSAPNGLLARALSYFPITSPVTMMLRLSSAAVPTVDIVGTVIVGAASVYLALRGASKVFRTATLMYGKRPTLPELIRWLRAA